MFDFLTAIKKAMELAKDGKAYMRRHMASEGRLIYIYFDGTVEPEFTMMVSDIQATDWVVTDYNPWG